MKAAYITALAAFAASVVAAPTKITQDIETVTQSLNIPVASAITSSSSKASSGANGEIVQDAGSQVKDVLEITGPNAKRLLIQLSPDVAGLLSTLGLPAVGTPVGAVVASASSVGDLVKNLGKPVDGLLTVVGEGGEYLLVSLSPSLAGLLSGLGLPGVGVPVGSVVATVGKNLKRDGMVVGDNIPKVQDILEVTGTNSQRLLIQLSPEAASLVSGLGLPSVGEPVGEVVDEASSVGELVNHTGAPTNQLLTVVGTDGKALLIKLAPSVARLLGGLGLSGVGASVGSIVATLGNNL
ncbi:uncharacterized protein DSM5745_05676 [Aspergillus mulundensis]|uniref:Uncharacterized protein n=1 Tax=Aspergillus mulundensis TaxID=1810919 RepID=A0A3D8RY94_9EURO|nr:Uncharacterized protein DSM5745_05676 [Aspergillus mulundensis]RDW78824.1 Uncharacterized protein DSM5745_05676 [Aspergillus mulundensis]